MVHTITSFEEFQQLKNGDETIIIDFWAEWCGPCRAISPVFEKADSENQDSRLKFYKVNIDDQPKIAEDVGIRSIPAFMVFNKGNKLNELVGARPDGLKDLINQAKAG